MPTLSPTINNPAITVKNLTVRLGDYKALDHIDAVIPDGSFTAIIGPNGSGKSTFVKAILNLLPSKGEIVFSKRQPKIAYVPQFMEIDRSFPITLKEFLRLYNDKINDHEIEAALELVRLPVSHLNQSFGSLSGGQRQRAILAEALLKKPEILILDEPISNIDQKGEEQIEEILSRLHKESSVTIVLISHDIHFVASAVDHVICLDKELKCSGSPKAILTPENIEDIFAGKHIHHHH